MISFSLIFCARTARGCVLFLLFLCYIFSGRWLLTAPMPRRFVPPPNSSVMANSWSSSNSSHLMHRRDFQWLMQSNKCNGELFLLILVHSAPSHLNRRNAIRKTWGNNVDGAIGNGSNSFRVLFLIGQVESRQLQRNLDKESEQYGDLIQGNFLDSYKNLTYKHVMGLKWVTHYCPSVPYILKCDDDIFVDTIQVLSYIRRTFGAAGSKGVINCFVYPKSLVKRSHRSKWYVSVAEFKPRYYPEYCAGSAIVYSQDVVQSLYEESFKHEYFWIDDVFVSGVLASKLNINKVPLRDELMGEEGQWLEEKRPSMVGYHGIPLTMMETLWNRTVTYHRSR